jgi:antiviral helicase SKI2
MSRAPGAAPAGSGVVMAKGGGMNVSFVRGKGSYVPFTPGGLDNIAFDAIESDRLVHTLEGVTHMDQVQEEKEEEEAGTTWKYLAPGMKRGLKLSGADEFLQRVLGDQGMTTRARRRKKGGVDDIGLGDEDDEGIDQRIKRMMNKTRHRTDIDDLLPISVS